MCRGALVKTQYTAPETSHSIRNEWIGIQKNERALETDPVQLTHLISPSLSFEPRHAGAPGKAYTAGGLAQLAYACRPVDLVQYTYILHASHNFPLLSFDDIPAPEYVTREDMQYIGTT